MFAFTLNVHRSGIVVLQLVGSDLVSRLLLSKDLLFKLEELLKSVLSTRRLGARSCNVGVLMCRRSYDGGRR